MYYFVKIIDGKLMYKTRPKGPWRFCSIEHVLERWHEVKKTNEKLNKQLTIFRQN